MDVTGGKNDGEEPVSEILLLPDADADVAGENINWEWDPVVPIG